MCRSKDAQSCSPVFVVLVSRKAPAPSGRQSGGQFVRTGARASRKNEGTAVGHGRRRELSNDVYTLGSPRYKSWGAGREVSEPAQ